MKNYFLLLTLLCLSLSARAHDAEVDGIFYDLDAANKTATVTYKGDDYNSYSNEYSGDSAHRAAIRQKILDRGFKFPYSPTQCAPISIDLGL